MENPFKELRYSDNLTHEEIISQKEVKQKKDFKSKSCFSVVQVCSINFFSHISPTLVFL